MVGEYRIEVSNRYSKYFLNIRRNITILQGNSATGKTELIRMLSQYEDNGESSGIHVVSDVPLHILSGRNWKRDLGYIHGSIVFLDETEQYARSREFAECAQKSDNYYVIVNRDPLPQLSYAVCEIYAFREASSSQKYHEAYRVYNEMVPLYNMDINRKIQPLKVITEDTNSGFQFFQAMYRKDCIAAGGKSRILHTIRQLTQVDEDVLVIVDGAAFGAEIEGVMNYLWKHNRRCIIYAPESFEYLLLKAGFVPIRKDILEHTYKYADSTEYISWEDFYTKTLTEQSQGTPFRYQKQRLNPAYLSELAMRRVSHEMPRQILPQEV